MSTRSTAEQICAVLILELGISKKEAHRFIEFYTSAARRFDFEDGVMRGGWFLRGTGVSGDPLLRQKHSSEIKAVNHEIEAILTRSREGVERVPQVA